MEWRKCWVYHIYQSSRRFEMFQELKETSSSSIVQSSLRSVATFERLRHQFPAGRSLVSRTALPCRCEPSLVRSTSPTFDKIRVKRVISPAESIMTHLGDEASSCSMSCVLRARRALKGVGSANASSKLLVCRDWVPPNTAAIASTVVRIRLLYGSCSQDRQSLHSSYLLLYLLKLSGK